MIIVAKSDGRIRVCIDPRPLNKALKIKDTHHAMTSLEDILPDLGRAKVFSLLNIKNAFWSVELDEYSSKLTTMMTPFAKYRWLRMPFGLIVSSAEFSSRLHAALIGLKGIACIADDILIYGTGDDVASATINHHNNLIALLDRCRAKEIKLNKDKFRFCVPEVLFMGHRLTTRYCSLTLINFL
jgi:hypothetical protein